MRGWKRSIASEDMRATLPREYIEGASAEVFRRRFLKNTPADYAAAADAILQTPDMTGRLGEIQAPTWVCVGEKDAGSMAYGRDVRGKNPSLRENDHSRLRAFSDAGCARGFFLRVR